MFTETSVHFSHSVCHHIPEDTVSTSNLTTYSSTPQSDSYCQLFFYHSRSAWLLPRCCLLQTFCKKQHCNVATSSGLQPNYTIIALEQQKCQTLRQVPG